MQNCDVCVVGLGYVGLTFAAFCGQRGYRVIGVERNPRILEKTRKGRAHFLEPGLDEELTHLVAEGRLDIQSSIPERADGIRRVYIISVGTPLAEGGRSADFTAIDEVWGSIAQDTSPGDLIILRSTVSIGTTRLLALRLADEYAGNGAVAFCPERTIEGNAVTELAELPQIVGGCDERATEEASQFFNNLDVEVVPTAEPEEAELAKLAANTERDISFAFANELAMVCDGWGISYERVRNAVRYKYPRCSLGFAGPAAGPCLEKDGWILAESSRTRGVEAKVTCAARSQNETLASHIAVQVEQRLTECLGDGDVPVTVGIAGLAFKGRPETNDIRGSLAPAISREVSGRARIDSKIYGFDPIVDEASAATLDVIPVPSMSALAEICHAVIIQTNHPYWASYNWMDLLDQIHKPFVVFDLWGTVPETPFNSRENAMLIRLGG